MTILAKNHKEEFLEKGYSTQPFPSELRAEMLQHIENHIRDLANAPGHLSLEEAASSIPDEIWSKKMHRAFRMFPDSLAKKIHDWGDSSIRTAFDKSKSAINTVSQQETKINPKLKNHSLAIYWRCVRPNKPDAGRAHRDATFWVLELEGGYDPQIPFPFDYIQDSIKVWIPLQGCTPQTSLQIVPYSHKEEIPIAIDDTEYGRRPNIENGWLQAHEQDFISPIELSQNCCILFHMDLVHRGPTHKNNKLRISAEFTLVVSN